MVEAIAIDRQYLKLSLVGVEHVLAFTGGERPALGSSESHPDVDPAHVHLDSVDCPRRVELPEVTHIVQENPVDRDPDSDIRSMVASLSGSIPVPRADPGRSSSTRPSALSTKAADSIPTLTILGSVPGCEHELLEYDRTSQIAAVGGDLGHIGPLDAEVVDSGLAASSRSRTNPRGTSTNGLIVPFTVSVV